MSHENFPPMPSQPPFDPFSQERAFGRPARSADTAAPQEVSFPDEPAAEIPTAAQQFTVDATVKQPAEQSTAQVQQIPEQAQRDARQGRKGWREVLIGAQGAPSSILQAYGQRRATIKKELPEYDEETGRPIVSREKHDFDTVSPDIIFVSLTKRPWWAGLREEVKNAAKHPKNLKGWVKAAKAALPDYVKEESTTVGWFVSNDIIQTKESKAAEQPADSATPADDAFDAAAWLESQWKANRQENQQPEQAVADNDKDDLVNAERELMVFTSGGELLRLRGSDITPEEGSILRLAHVPMPEHDKKVEDEVEAAKQLQRGAEAYFERNRNKFTTLSIVGRIALTEGGKGVEIEGKTDPIATPERVYDRIDEIWMNAQGFRKAED